MFTNQISTQEIIGSRLLAKAAVEKNGKIFIVAIFERSEYHRFFFKFTANSKRSPHKAWKFLPGQYFGINAGMGKTHNLKTFMEQNYSGCEIKIRNQYKAKYVQTFVHRIGHPFEGLKVAPLPGQTFEYANSITSGKPRKIAYRGAPNRK